MPVGDNCRGVESHTPDGGVKITAVGMTTVCAHAVCPLTTSKRSLSLTGGYHFKRRPSRLLPQQMDAEICRTVGPSTAALRAEGRVAVMKCCLAGAGTGAAARADAALESHRRSPLAASPRLLEDSLDALSRGRGGADPEAGIPTSSGSAHLRRQPGAKLLFPLSSLGVNVKRAAPVLVSPWSP